MNPPKKGIVVDGATRGNPGPSEYRGIDLETGEILFYQKIGIATNNIAEFCALGHAILLMLEKNKKTTIYSDSQTAISWIRKTKANSTLPESEKTQKAKDYVQRIEQKLREKRIQSNGVDLFIGEPHNQIRVEKWHTSEFGEIPADFGNKK
jgi:ribonuclease HI